jgi:hypothetical protein
LRFAKLKPEGERTRAKCSRQLGTFYFIFGLSETLRPERGFTKAQSLSDEDRNPIKAMLKAFIFQKDMQKQLAQ